MRAAVIGAVGEAPELVGDYREPEGDTVVEVAAAPVNPVDLSIASGRFYAGPPSTPYVPGSEAGIAAWVPLEHRAKVQEGETVLVLGATGVVGQIAVQAAKLLGAGKVIAAGRDPERLDRVETDAHVRLPTTADALGEAADGLIDVVIDPLWGEHAPVATEAMNVNGRLVILGQSAGQQATFDAGVVRGKALQILGHGNAVTPPEVKYGAFRAMCDHAAAGELKVEYEELPLDQVADAWERQASSPHVKLILVP
jgi:NADPH2:quinone reductase